MLTASEWQKGLLWLGLGAIATAVSGGLAMLLHRLIPKISTGWSVALSGAIVGGSLSLVAMHGLPDWMMVRHYLVFVLPASGLVLWMMLFLWAYFGLQRELRTQRQLTTQLAHGLTETLGNIDKSMDITGTMAEARLGTEIAKLDGKTIERMGSLERQLEQVQERLKRIESQETPRANEMIDAVASNKATPADLIEQATGINPNILLK
jgi:hypothetical protein